MPLLSRTIPKCYCKIWRCNPCYLIGDGIPKKPSKVNDLDKFSLFAINVIGFFFLFSFVLMKLWFKLVGYFVSFVCYVYKSNWEIKLLCGLILIFACGSLIAHVTFGSPIEIQNKQSLAAPSSQLQNRTQQKEPISLESVSRVNSKFESKHPLHVELKNIVTSPFHSVTHSKEKLFTVTISQGRKKLFQTLAKVTLPIGETNPPLLLTVDPILVTNYT